MSFGLRNTPKTPQRTMDNVRYKCTIFLWCLNYCTLKFCTMFIWSSSSFVKIKQKETLCRSRKCHSACTRIKYLRHWIPPRTLIQGKVMLLWRSNSFNRNVHIAILYNIFPKFTNPLLTALGMWYSIEVSMEKMHFEPLINAWFQTEYSNRLMKQNHSDKTFIIRINGSNYTLGTVLL